jgi:hypothetical protein
MSHEPSYFDRMKMGFVMGGVVGGCMGFVIGSFTVLNYGPGPGGYMRTIGRHMLNSGGMFSVIMSFGSLIRNEQQFKLENNIYKRNYPVSVVQRPKLN